MTLQKSIAVLPFENLSSDPENDYFSDGITEEIINALSRIDGLKVTARTSSFAFKGLNEDVRIIGNKLGVETVLEGSIRRSGNRVRISAKLVRTDHGFSIWSERFDREMADIFDLQDEISLLIAEKIREHFGHIDIKDHLVETRTENIKAYEMLLKGSYHFKRKDFEDIQLAMQYFNKAVALDPSLAEAFAFIGETFLHYSAFNLVTAEEAFSKAREAVSKALSLDETEVRAHKVMAYIHLFYDWNWNGAIESYNKAVEGGLRGENEFITYYYIFLQKDYNKAISIAKENAKNDPLHVISHWQLGLCYYFAGQFEEALKAFDQSLELDANFSESWRWKGQVLGYLNRFEEAFEAVDKALEITKGQGLAQLDKLTIKVLHQETEGVLEELEKTEFMDPCDPAQLYSLMNLPNKAVECLKKGLQDRSVMMVTLKHFWVWDNIREHAGFQEVYAQMHFEDQKTHKTSAHSNLLTEQKGKLSDSEVAQVLAQLEELMNDEEVITDSNLSLRSLAEMVAIHPNRLSWVLNQQIGKNFNEYVNEFRLEIFKEKALDKRNSHLTLLGLAYESGFSSKSVFNDYFKRTTNSTPKAWVKAQMK